ncbi:MAG: hypothetical protein JST00_34660 [Deltaproteobacteria bacterium]|nr:hypothetical protein [Deltaproteobacteria bacterium]
MATLQIGIRIDMEKGIAFFGVEEVNRQIAAGARILELRPGGAIMSKLGGDGQSESFTLSGCQFEVVLGDS